MSYGKELNRLLSPSVAKKIEDLRAQERSNMEKRKARDKQLQIDMFENTYGKLDDIDVQYLMECTGGPLIIRILGLRDIKMDRMFGDLHVGNREFTSLAEALEFAAIVEEKQGFFAKIGAMFSGN